jgi:hypothetical protein
MTAFPDEAFLAAIPVHALASEPGEEGTMTLIRPKILSPRWAWLVRMMKRPNYLVKLDARGTAAWRACDGHRGIADVIALVSAAFPGEPDTTLRTALFIRELARGGFIHLHQKDQA